MSYFHYQSKQIYYQEIGSGTPLIMLHGDTASSVMFELLLPLYQEHFRVILMDFLGNGRSDRVAAFPADLWITQAEQVIALIDHLELKEANLLGTSGGAWVAINTALKWPNRIGKVIADSFDGRSLHDGFEEDLIKEREFAKGDSQARQFYEWCQGEDWETVVDQNTQALVQCAEKRLPLFSEPLDALRVPILFTGSLVDSMCRRNLLEEYTAMTGLVKEGNIHMFQTGGHPAVASNAEAFAELCMDFLKH